MSWEFLEIPSITFHDVIRDILVEERNWNDLRMKHSQIQHQHTHILIHKDRRWMHSSWRINKRFSFLLIPIVTLYHGKWHENKSYTVSYSSHASRTEDTSEADQVNDSAAREETCKNDHCSWLGLTLPRKGNDHQHVIAISGPWVL